MVESIFSSFSRGKKGSWRALSHWAGLWMAGLTCVACATAPQPPPAATVSEASDLPNVPSFVKVPHPVGYELAEIRVLFESPLAPKDGLGEFASNCDQDYQALLRLTSSRQDRRQGAFELVSIQAEKMHWCFYAKIAQLIQGLKSQPSWKARQQLVLDTYEFLNPIANAFLENYQESRYLRWATGYYSSISEWIFFRKVVPGPENTLALTMSATSYLENWGRGQKKPAKVSVFTRYGITVEEEKPAELALEAEPTRETPMPPSLSKPQPEPEVESVDLSLDTQPNPAPQAEDVPVQPIRKPEIQKPARDQANRAKSEPKRVPAQTKKPAPPPSPTPMPAADAPFAL